MGIPPNTLSNLEYGEVLFIEGQLSKYIEKENEANG